MTTDTTTITTTTAAPGPDSAAAERAVALLDADTRASLARLARVLRYAGGIWFDDVPELQRGAVLCALANVDEAPADARRPGAVYDLAVALEALLRAAGDESTKEPL